MKRTYSRYREPIKYLQNNWQGVPLSKIARFHSNQVFHRRHRGPSRPTSSTQRDLTEAELEDIRVAWQRQQQQTHGRGRGRGQVRTQRGGLRSYSQR